MKVKIISDGTASGTKLIDQETGKSIEDITSITWSVSVDELAQVNVKFINVPVEVIGEIEEGE